MIEKFINIFEGLERAYGQFKKNDKKLSVKVEGRPWIEHKPITKQLWENHLNGVGNRLGIFPLKDDGTCKWGAIDIDVNNYDYESLLQKIRKLKLPLIMFRSKSGRAHVYMFMKQFTSAEEVQLVMKKFAGKLGLANILDRVYPMQTSLADKKDGSWLNMPYFHHEEGSTYAYTDDFEDASIDQFFEMYDQYAQTDLIDYLQEEVPEAIKKVKKPKEKKLEDFFLPCTKNCLKLNDGKIPNENRNDYLLHMYTWSMRAVEKGVNKIEAYSKMDAKTLLKHFNQEYMARPLEEKEIDNTVLKSTDREYKYLCKRQQIKKHCDASACVRHLCGISPEQAADLVEAEQAVGDITEYTSKPPIFYESVDVKNRTGDGFVRIKVEMQGSDLIDKQKWVNILANAGNFPHPAVLKMKPIDFQAFQYARLEKRVYEEADEEASDLYEFKIMVYNFVRKATVSFDKSVLLDNGCYVDQNTHDLHFKLGRLVEYFRSQKDNTSIKKICFNLRHIMKAKKNNGKVYNPASKKEVSCPTWQFVSDPNEYHVLGDNSKPTNQITHEEN
jgi:hypothetical protein